MAEKSPVYAGVEIVRSAGHLRRAFVYAALDDDRELLALGHGDLDEILAYLGGQQTAIAAINTPHQPNTGAVNSSTTDPNELPSENPSPPVNAGLCEVLLRQEGFKMDFTPKSAESCPGWLRRGFDLYSQLAAFDYLPYPNQDSTRQCLETCRDAVFWRLLGHKLPLPASLEGRLQRQLILSDQQMPVPDAMAFFMEITRYRLVHGDLPDEDIHISEELNALTAALIAWQAAHHPDQVELLGDPNEGQIVLPVSP